MKNRQFTAALLLLITLLTACSGDRIGSNLEGLDSHSESTSQGETNTSPEKGSVGEVTEAVSAVYYDLGDLDADDMDVSVDGVEITMIEFSGEEITIEGSGLAVAGNVVTIESGGAYLISGHLTDGQILVDTYDTATVRLILDNVNLTSSISAPIDIRSAEKTVITLAEGSENIITDGTSYVLDKNDEPNAAIFSNDDLTINGNGSLTVNANYNHGIASDDDLKIISGNITITSANDGLKGRDSITVVNGVIFIDAGGDGMQSQNNVDAGKGNIFVEEGQIEIHAAQDGIQAENLLSINGGNITITTGGGSGDMVVSDYTEDWDRDSINQAGKTNTATESVSAKGLKAGVDLIISGGALQIDAADDALHSDGSIKINAGIIELASGDDGIHADTLLEINGGTVDIRHAYEGLESASIIINDGTLSLVSTDDGINGSNKADGDDRGGFPGRNGSEAANSNLSIHGGSIYIESGGDGIDINGPIEMTGGIVIVNGPTNNQNAALDFTGSFNISGGTFVAAGSAGMAQAPSENSSQLSVMVNFGSAQTAGTIFHIETESGETILTFTPAKKYQSVVVSSPDLQNGGTYSIYSGGTASGSSMNGLFGNGSYIAGILVDFFTISNVTTIVGQTGGGMPPRPDGSNNPGGRP